MRRRTHRKSRTGCVECKRRHVKCDEGRPACVNCKVAERRCSYAAATASPRTPSTSSPSPAPSHVASKSGPSTVSSTVSSVTASSVSQTSIPLQSTGQNDLNMHHLELLWHIWSADALPFGQKYVEASIKAIVPSAFKASYLMHQLLAMSALHFSTLRPAQKDFYMNEAAELQTRALSLFNVSQEDVTADNCVPMFVFSSMLGMHVLFTTVACHNEDFNTLLENYIDYLYLHRGVRIITSRSWKFLLASDLRAVLEPNTSIVPTSDMVGQECEGLRRLVDGADLGAASIQTCQAAIAHLQWVFDAQRMAGGADIVFAWPVAISVEYVDLLKQRRPEALAILAHYAVLLHYNNDLWIIGNSGRYLIEAITRYLGTYWESWLAWPNVMLSTASPPSASQTSRS